MEPIGTDEFAEWYGGLDASDQAIVEHLVGLLEQRGVQLGFPYSSAIRGSKYALRELRSSSSASVLRILYAFDPARDAS